VGEYRWRSSSLPATVLWTSAESAECLRLAPCWRAWLSQRNRHKSGFSLRKGPPPKHAWYVLPSYSIWLCHSQTPERDVRPVRPVSTRYNGSIAEPRPCKLQKRPATIRSSSLVVNTRNSTTKPTPTRPSWYAALGPAIASAGPECGKNATPTTQAPIRTSASRTTWNQLRTRSQGNQPTGERPRTHPASLICPRKTLTLSFSRVRAPIFPELPSTVCHPTLLIFLGAGRCGRALACLKGSRRGSCTSRLSPCKKSCFWRHRFPTRYSR